MTYTPFRIEGQDRPARWLITCDHAVNVVPPCVNGGSLGLDPADMERHIAYDIGAEGLAS
ncbi:MAG: N-formylglutamate amidohydrolase, partial [Pseudomonadota bacterium]